MKINDWKFIFITVTIILTAYVYYPILIEYLPKSKQEKYVSLALLDSKGLTNDYYHVDNIVYINRSVYWQIKLSNKMNEPIYVSYHIKLLGRDDDGPNLTLCNPSEVNAFHVFYKAIDVDDEVLFPFVWNIDDFIYTNDTIFVSSITVNNHTNNVQYLINDGDLMRMIVEVWIYDENIGDFRFFWDDLGENRCIWNQIQFSLSINKII